MSLTMKPHRVSGTSALRHRLAGPSHPLRHVPAPPAGAISPLHISATWQRPTPNRDEEFVRPSYVPGPQTQPDFFPNRREEQPLYTPSLPEFKPAELPEQGQELPSGPKMPERRPDPIPAGNPKKETPPGEEKREAPPAKPKEQPKQ